MVQTPELWDQAPVAIGNLIYIGLSKALIIGLLTWLVMIRVMGLDIELLLPITQVMEIQSTKCRGGQIQIISGHFVLWNK